MSKADLIISLDFELHWGRFDKYDLRDYQEYYTNALDCLPRILDLFERYSIRATWATVGMLMAENWEEWNEYAPEIQPDFCEKKYSAVEWGRQQMKNGSLGLFAPEMVNRIRLTPGQELASHTFSHFFTAVQGSTLSAFESDLRACRTIAKSKYGVDLESLVFPRNQYYPEVFNVAAKAGFSAVRTNPSDWFWKETAHESLLKKIFRTGDTLFPLGKNTCFNLGDLESEPILQLPSSRLLRPYRKGSIFNGRRISRIKGELENACIEGKCYHLWWHPHNFGHFPEENLAILEDLLIFIHELMESNRLQSISMKDASALNQKINLEK
ncbi:polysaccharide deacetylase family protein [Algoriphagus sp. NG3]|uniref:polysaccharide deacetylase family protein n=1 Tax=Algoriphagus sp. NG3 TaxID=3097546 RepID=UPI002A825B4B|nr:polysaccharide deacetylase family protein [Algoriphagus sp. NG3]WPR76867.1 polysaccharide deacetylase family protein [Algoriphagus sp. NG3]